MLHGMAFKVFDALLAGPLVFLFFLTEIHKFFDNFKEPLVLFVNHLNANVILVQPFQLIFHDELPPLCV